GQPGGLPQRRASYLRLGRQDQQRGGEVYGRLAKGMGGWGGGGVGGGRGGGGGGGGRGDRVVGGGGPRGRGGGAGGCRARVTGGCGEGGEGGSAVAGAHPPGAPPRAFPGEVLAAHPRRGGARRSTPGDRPPQGHAQGSLPQKRPALLAQLEQRYASACSCRI